MFCFLILSVASYSQIKIGVSAGVGISNRTNDEARNAEQAVVANNSEIGSLLGVDINVPLNKRWFVSSGVELKTLSFSEKLDVENFNLINSDFEFSCVPAELPAEGIAPIKHKFGFVQIPVMVNYVFANCEDCGWQWSLGVGPTIDFSLNHKVKSPVFYKEEFVKADCLERQSVVFGLQAEIGGQYGIGEKSTFGLSLFYDQQLQSVYDNSLNYNLGWFGLKASYYFAFSAFK